MDDAFKDRREKVTKDQALEAVSLRLIGKT